MSKSLSERKAEFLDGISRKWDECAQDGTQILVAVSEVHPVTKFMGTHAAAHLDGTNRGALMACGFLLMNVGKSKPGSTLDDICKAAAQPIVLSLMQVDMPDPENN